ncbi:FHA domain-containing protein [Mycetocola spongiae]|uniref:FHA domain-containing protein n=1 Tax=Mycetocola spongiae TaxID=2859226 RepID=UPI001CF2D272|nr:FHA domain-containing protein [Mycetocola spongiae]UCR90384.1 FHA domain-containing protein [Mycetocola spongiae]
MKNTYPGQTPGAMVPPPPPPAENDWEISGPAVLENSYWRAAPPLPTYVDPGEGGVAPEEGTVMIAPLSAGTEEDDATVFVDRTPPPRWRLVPEEGAALELPAEDLILGRKPRALAGTEALIIPDPSRTISKTHARLRFVEDSWLITDLGATNGVLLCADDGTEVPIEPHIETPVLGSMLIGTVCMRIERIADAPADGAAR